MRRGGYDSIVKIMSVNRIYGWRPDVPDQRDYFFKAIRPRIRAPKTIDLRKYCSKIENQGALGSCTAQALAGNLEFLDNRTDQTYVDVSRLFIYYNERVLEGSVNDDSGAMLRDGIKTLKKDGVCEEALWPYLIQRFARKPLKKCYDDAQQHKISSYYRIETLSEMLDCLADGYPFVFGFAVYESFESVKVAKTGVVPMPARDERQLGGHAVMAVGYHQKTKRFLVRNSWGSKWGQGGYFTMPFQYLETLADDFWTIRK
ncbi:MAG: C1 family peptidase [Candidatus Omnitrophica bacterium]|nr:C1 family peptidase [Candidatus Omnitrophota bacterium]